MTISGMMTLTYVRVSNRIRNRRGTRWSPRAAIVPNAVARIALTNAIVALFQSARWTFGSANARSYHLRLKPCQSVT